MSISSDLKWLLLRKHSSFLIKRNGIQFSSEKGNLMNLNSFKYSGLASDQSVDIKSHSEGGIQLSTKHKKKSFLRKPSRMWNSIILKKDFRRVSRSIKHILKNYRPDLMKVALAKWTRIAKPKHHRIVKTKKNNSTSAKK
jgi:large subunit ribosomal protein L28e